MIGTACTPLPYSNSHSSHATHPVLKDSAPAQPKTIAYHAVHPKTEPISRYGNPDSYRVAGRRYEVMTRPGGYKQKGIASWYGTKFHRKRTSSGENYNMYAMTAAHRTLPIPSYIKVKNLNNGRTAIVRVNDRGPFHSSRLIDLSYAAAKYLGFLPKGTAPVEIEAVTPKGARKNQVARYYIQAGAFGSKTLAETLRNKLRKHTRIPIQVAHYQQHFIVKVGPFENKQSTVLFKTRLAKQGLPGVFSFLQ